VVYFLVFNIRFPYKTTIFNLDFDTKPLHFIWMQFVEHIKTHITYFMIVKVAINFLFAKLNFEHRVNFISRTTNRNHISS